MTAANEKIDVHRAKHTYLARLDKLRCESTIWEANKEHILRFLHDCKLGKTVLNRQKKRIGEKRLLKYLFALRNINEWLGNKNFATVTQADMEHFIGRVDENNLTRLRGGVAMPVSYTAWTRRDIKLCVRKFYKWLHGESKYFPDLVSWIDTSIEEGAPNSLSLEEIRRCAEYCAAVQGKARLWTLFETGARSEEFLNIRIEHVEDKGSHLVVRIEYPKTFKRSLPVFEGASHLREWLSVHPERDQPAAQVFPIQYGAFLAWIHRLGRKALGKDRRIHPHLIRDSFATWLASKKVGRYQMCKMMGWAMSSDMPDRYINRVGVVEEEAIQAIRGDELSKVERENADLKTALSRLEAQSNSLQERLDKRAEIDRFLTVLLKDEELGKVLVERVKKNGLGNALLKL